MSSGLWNSTTNALRAERSFHPGQAIRWNPPPGAYSAHSLQCQCAGQTGRVERVYNDCYLLAAFKDRSGVLLNLDFVEAL